MSTAKGPISELSFQVAPDAVPEFQQWVLALAEQALREHGIADAVAFKSRDVADEGESWTCQLQYSDEADFDASYQGFLASTEAALAQRFGDAVNLSSRVLKEESTEPLFDVASPNCLNCGALLRGQYCGICGQRARNRLISLWELISDAFGDLLEIDSRLWRTLIPLLRRPGRLTRDYLEGRRARYMPPFRTYLVLSVIFFVVAFFDPRDDLGLLFEPEPEPTLQEQAEKDARAAEKAQEVLDELAAEGIIPADQQLDEARQGGREDAHSEQEAGGGLNIQFDEETGSCNVESGDLEDLPEWFKRRFTTERIKQVCEKVTADGGKSFGDLLLDNVPVALIVLLPLMALVLKILYPLSRRYFVEHLLFVIHYHAFFFLILILQILFARLATLIRIPDFLATLTIVAVSFYIPVYLYMAMRHVYGQGRILTFLKYLALVVAYSIGTALTMLGAVFFALVSVSV